MSHYAKLVEWMPAFGGEGAVILQPGERVKKITLVGDVHGSKYVFWAEREASQWRQFWTTEDLPAFTDKGRAARAARKQPTIFNGRPRRKHGGAGKKNITVRVRQDQHDKVEKNASKRGTDISGYVRKLLVDDGMPE